MVASPVAAVCHREPGHLDVGPGAVQAGLDGLGGLGSREAALELVERDHHALSRTIPGIGTTRHWGADRTRAVRRPRMGRKRRQSRTRGATERAVGDKGSRRRAWVGAATFGALAAVLALVGFVGDDRLAALGLPERRARPGLGHGRWSSNNDRHPGDGRAAGSHRGHLRALRRPAGRARRGRLERCQRRPAGRCPTWSPTSATAGASPSPAYKGRPPGELPVDDVIRLDRRRVAAHKGDRPSCCFGRGRPLPTRSAGSWRRWTATAGVRTVWVAGPLSIRSLAQLRLHEDPGCTATTSPRRSIVRGRPTRTVAWMADLAAGVVPGSDPLRARPAGRLHPAQAPPDG